MGFNHFDEKGNAVMVDISGKDVTYRTATARGSIHVSPEIMDAVLNRTMKKGDVLGVARVAGIMAVKQTSSIIPMCHPLLISKCSVDFDVCPEEQEIRAVCTVRTEGRTGVEMEASRSRCKTVKPSSLGSMMSSRTSSGVFCSSASQNWDGRSKPSASMPWLWMV